MKQLTIALVILAAISSGGLAFLTMMWGDGLALGLCIGNIVLLHFCLHALLEKKPSRHWITDSTDQYGEVLHGFYAHWCNEWDGLPIDWTRPEFAACTCFTSIFARILRSVRRRLEHRTGANDPGARGNLI